MPYNFQSVGGAATSALEELLVRRQAQQRQRFLDEIMKRNSDSQIADREMNRKIQQSNVDSLDEARNTAAADRIAGKLSPDQTLDPETTSTLKKGGYGALVVPGQEKFGMLPPDQGEGPTLETTPDKFRGTAQQTKATEDRKRAEEYLQSLDPASKEAQALRYELSTGKGAPAGMFDKEPNKPALVQEYEYYVNQAKGSGQQPISFDEFRKKARANGGSPYYIPAQTAQGIVPFNTRTGEFNDPNRRDLKPGEGAQKDMTNAKSVLYTIGDIEQQFTPDRVGVLKGRYNNMQLALMGEMGQEGLADMQSAIATLKDTVINLRTGAQMSEPEAKRILQEVPDTTLPPDVFVARLSRAKSYFQNWLKDRSKMAYGRTTTADVDQTVNGDVKPMPAHTPTDAPSTPSKSKYKVSVQ